MDRPVIRSCAMEGADSSWCSGGIQLGLLGYHYGSHSQPIHLEVFSFGPLVLEFVGG